ncbi:hypothetical protein AB0H57_03155 [Micromonospora sp. NPDC050686]|uniref:hypothetical protein n=1 Tax=Micromonospora sp. NPDC050686 TaxID=3154631 RepID=UPI0033E68053
MATEDGQTDEERPPGWPEIGEPPAGLPSERRGDGDAEQLAELAGAEDEPLAVDEPVRIRAPYGGAQKRRNQRPLPG